MKTCPLSLALLIATGCVTTRAPNPAAPPVVSPGQADRLYAKQRVRCADQKCTLNGQTYPMGAFVRTTNVPGRTVLTRSRRVRRAIEWPLFGLGIAAGIGTGISALNASSSANPKYDFMLQGFAATTAVSILSGLLVRFLWQYPEEAFETAYNDSLREQLGQRTSDDPETTYESLTANLNAGQRACVQRYGDQLGKKARSRMLRCIERRARYR